MSRNFPNETISGFPTPFPFENKQDALDAVDNLDGKEFDGQPMRVEMAKGPNPNRR